MAAAAAEEGVFPASFGKLYPRYKTPYVAFVIMGLISTALLLGNAALSSSAANVFWMTFKRRRPRDHAPTQDGSLG